MIQDAGGVPLADGGRMRTGLVYRISGALAGPEQLADLTATGLKTVVDLRHETEDRSAVADWAAAHGAEYCNYGIAVGGYENGAYGVLWQAVIDGMHEQYLLDLYAEIATGFGPQFAAGFEALSRGFPAGFGCAAGKDRTGVMSAYLHVLLGASEETAIDAYLEKAPSVAQLRPTIERLYPIGPGDEIPEGLLHIILVHRKSMMHAFDSVRALGGVERFLLDHGLTEAAIARLREALIEPA
jgi:protein-tyrosine phosphatase